MFNMTKIRATNGSGKSFYANHLCSNDYYSEHEKVQGYWRGELADAFGLRDKVLTSKDFSLFQRNVNPKTPGKLTQKNMPGGPRFFDFQVAAPKSVSVMSMFDERLVEAHRESVRIAMAELERLAAVRVRDGENVRTNNYETTGKLVYAEFMHDTSRALDPQLHTHNVVCNVTRAGDGRYKALETLEMCRAIRYAGKVYHNEMAARCRELGYETVETRDRKGNVIWYDLACVPADVMERFSKRRQQIEKAEAEFIAEHGRKPTLSENNYLSTSTRTDKMLTSTSEKVREFQMGQLGHREEAQLYAAAKRAKEHGSSSVPLDCERIIEQVRNVIGELYERESVLKLDKILAEVLNRNLGKAGEVAKSEAVAGKQLVLANGKRIFAKGASDFIDVGELRKIELCEGDLIQFRVNLKAKKIYNGTLARVSADPGKVEILYSDGRPRELIDMPENYAVFDYGWVTTSHKSQGRTAENVVVAAESLDRKAFYVALSRGRRKMSLHCPDKEHLKRGLAYRTGERASIHDLIRDREIPEGAMLPLSEPARERKAELLPDFSYKDMAARAKTAMRKVKMMLNDTAAIRRMRQHRERLYNEHTRFEVEEHAVGLLGKLVSRITGMFRTPEAIPQESPQADWEREREAERQQNLELACKRELEAQWNVFDGAWSGYVEKRKHYHELHGGGEAFELTDREAAFRKQQTTRQRHGKAPQPLPAWLEKWEDTARTEAKKSRAALTVRLEEAKRLKTAWEKADAEWAAHCTARKAYHAELGFKVPFRLWDKEYRYHAEQELRRRRGEFPQPMPESLVNWKAYMDEQKQQELRMFWHKAQKQWEELLAARRAVYEKQHVEAGFRLWPEEEAFAAAQQKRRAAGLEPEAIPAELYNWRERAGEEVQQLVEVAARQRAYEAKAQWKWKWQDFDEKWTAYVKNRTKPSTLEPIFQEEIELRRSSHREPPSIIELPDWMKIEEVLDIHERNLKIEEIRRKLGLHPGDEGQPVDPGRKLYYESKREELFRRIAVYDQRTAFEKLPGWMKKWNPSEAHKAKVQDAIYMKYDCKIEDEKSLEPLEWLELQNRKIKAKAEYAAYEHRLAVGPATDRQMDELKSFAAAGLLKEWPAEPDREEAAKLLEQLREQERQQKQAEERRRNPMADWQMRTLRELHEEGRLEKIPEDISSREASELIDRITFHDPASWMMKNTVRRNIENGLLPSSAARNLDSMTVGEFRKLQKVIMEKQQKIDRRREQWEREHPRDRGGLDL